MKASSVKSKRTRKTLYFSAISSIILLAILAFQWNIIDSLTPFLGLPIIGLAWLLVMLSAILGAIYIFRHRNEGISASAPLIISCAALFSGYFIPFTQLWLYANFHINKSSREKVVENVKTGIFIPHEKPTSIGGETVIIEGTKDKPFVFFFTYRGILDSYSGFLWVPEGGRPEQFGDLHESGTEIESFGGNWYFIGHH